MSAADLSPIASAPSPTSTTLISPKSSISLADVGPGPLSSIAAATPTTGPEAEALSNHHLQRYFHYKALAAQAEAEVNALAAIQNEPFEALLAGFSMPDPSVPYKDESNNNNMLAYQTQPSQSFYGVGAGVPQQGYSFSYQPQQAASMHHAQAQAHLQAHDAAARAAVAVQQQPRASLGGYFVPASNRSSFDVGPPQSLWSRASLSSQQSAASPPFPSTPNYTTQQMMAPPAPALAHAQYMAKSASTSSMSMTRPIQPPSLPLSEGENELEDELEDDDESMGQATLDGMPMTNLHGGGRGYVPGKTPDDPKKRHKCNLCGRGFARAFNLKVSLLCLIFSPLLLNCADMRFSLTSRRTTRSGPSRTCALTRRASAASPACTTSSATGKASTATAPSSTLSVRESPRRSPAPRAGSKGEPRMVVSYKSPHRDTERIRVAWRTRETSTFSPRHLLFPSPHHQPLPLSTPPPSATPSPPHSADLHLVPRPLDKLQNAAPPPWRHCTLGRGHGDVDMIAEDLPPG